jgi:hypothetical protein
MATTTFCDWCGELIETEAGKDAPELRVHGTSASRGRFFLFSPLAGGFNIHVEEISYAEIDPDCCLGKLETLLRERSSWAHDPEQGAQEWRLVARERRSLTARERRGEELKENSERHSRWKRMPRDERLKLIRTQLADGDLTIRELTERLEEEFPDIAFYEQMIRPVVAQMFKSGELDRQGEQWRPGEGASSIRYRYGLTEGGQP